MGERRECLQMVCQQALSPACLACRKPQCDQCMGTTGPSQGWLGATHSAEQARPTRSAPTQLPAHSSVCRALLFHPQWAVSRQPLATLPSCALVFNGTPHNWQKPYNTPSSTPPPQRQSAGRQTEACGPSGVWRSSPSQPLQGRPHSAQRTSIKAPPYGYSPEVVFLPSVSAHKAGLNPGRFDRFGNLFTLCLPPLFLVICPCMGGSQSN